MPAAAVQGSFPSTAADNHHLLRLTPSILRRCRSILSRTRRAMSELLPPLLLDLGSGSCCGGDSWGASPNRRSFSGGPAPGGCAGTRDAAPGSQAPTQLCAGPRRVGEPGGPNSTCMPASHILGMGVVCTQALECDGGERKIRNYSDKIEYAMHTPHITPKAHPLWAQEAVSEICRAAH